MALPKNKRKKTIDDIAALTNGQRAELIDGKIYYISPPSIRHQEIISKLSEIINSFISRNNKNYKIFTSPFPVYISNDKKNYVEPDLSIICNESKLKDNKCFGAPDWIIEVVSPKSKWTDYCAKLIKYHHSGVREYWITDHAERIVTTYNFEHETFNRYTFNDKIPSWTLDNFEIDFSEIQI